ncbi:HTH domain-containing protein [Runella sp.]|uniref:HTH domain-containing protein n=1 Tax=Runella sp. TaxID=1960881 RepID=UPI003D107B1E
MSLTSQIQRYKQLHQLIIKGATGSAKQLADKLGITERHVYNYLKELREMNIPIEYDPIWQTYYYTQPVHFEFSYGITPLNDSDLNTIEGGGSTKYQAEKIISPLKFYFCDVD